MLSPKTVLITGSNRGIGFELVKHFLKLKSPPTLLFATCRDPENAKELQDLAKANPSVVVVKLEATDQTSIDNARAVVEAKLGASGLNLLINNAGIMRYKGLIDTTAEDMMEQYKVNTIAPLMLTKAFLPLLKKAADSCKDKPMSCSKAAIINVSTGLSSISDNGMGGIYGYRASKAAVNMVTKSLSVDLKKDGILATVVHPGWVKTDLGGANAELTVDECATGMLKVFEKLQGEEETGKFYGVKGNSMGW